ncbi:telomere-capping, CST complex subunit-domain-containing protein [Helicostylum pulchrum]|uniref:Uncharacterized protein n=1 Tax=Helicostylum pulchrum TaxID=562976 RepID=A0ABP9Y0Y6_9FUNG|nr:telomere-capping, CST complex subunit-domain-containing protein [Helicostylum pulchrum]
MSTVPSARLVLLKDVKECRNGDSIRVTGLWKKYDAGIDLAVIQYDGHEVQVDTAHIDHIWPIEGDIVQCIGEVTEEATFGTVRMCARIIRIVNTLNLDLYEKVVQLRNSTMS